MIKETKCSIWNKFDVVFQANPDVNIIVGINGSGKTTMLNNLYHDLSKTKDKTTVVYIPSIDNIAMRDKRKNTNSLGQVLDYFIYDMKTGPSLMNYRMSMLDAEKTQKAGLKKHISRFIDIVNKYFAVSRKKIELDSNKLWVVNGEERLSTDLLSSGEKQLLLILLRVFLMENKEAYVLIDEPENSLDIEWQYELLNDLVELNPNAQFFITTHSPGIFGDGWGDKVFYMENITKIKE